jgi:hypothetical protein
LKVMPSRSKVSTELVTEMPRFCSISIQSDRVRRRSPRALTWPASRMAPLASSSRSVSVVLPASGWEMMAKVRRVWYGARPSVAGVAGAAFGMRGLAPVEQCHVAMSAGSRRLRVPNAPTPRVAPEGDWHTT